MLVSPCLEQQPKGKEEQRKRLPVELFAVLLLKFSPCDAEWPLCGLCEEHKDCRNSAGRDHLSGCARGASCHGASRDPGGCARGASCHGAGRDPGGCARGASCHGASRGPSNGCVHGASCHGASRDPGGCARGASCHGASRGPSNGCVHGAAAFTAPPVTAPAATTPAVALALAAAPVTALAAAPVTAPAATFPAAAPPMMTPLAGDSEEEEKQRVFLETWKQVPGDDGRPTQLPNIIDAAFPLTRPDWNFNTPEEAHLQALQLVQREVWKPLAKETSRWCPTPSRSGTPFGSDDTRPRAWNHGGRGPILSC
ncbi:uncharacterized protein LOC143268246 [Peromyscus maniculatus bairdii]|uniref:uncharacterized protein LOC143268246 n=1 Tax=Peromyscus maniculatus bairdii TaxID=230844 RepID=UPI003FCF8069